MAVHSLFEKKRVFNAQYSEWDSFVNGLYIQQYLLFYGVHNDTRRINTQEDIWNIKLGGRACLFDFNVFKDAHLKKLMKWAIFKFLSVSSSTTAHHAYEFLKQKQTFSQLRLDVLFNDLRGFILNAKETDRKYFPLLKRFIIFLINEGAPDTEIDDYYLFEQEDLLFPKKDTYEAYYDLEVKLNPLENQLIQDRTYYTYKKRENLTYSHLRDFVVLRICYEVGLRPIQLHKLSYNDFINIQNKYFSLLRPVVKKSKKSEGQKHVDNLDISRELGLCIKELIKRQVGTCKQLLQHENGQPSHYEAYHRGINRTLSLWTGSKELKKSIYDFRHNMAHSLAMSGASASTIAYMLGHSSTKVARHYISANPQIAQIREKALGKNSYYGSLVALLTGDIKLEKDWDKDKVSGIVGDELVTGIGGCASNDCEYNPVYSCYGCKKFNPFKDADHKHVLDALRREVIKQIAVSDKSYQIGMNPAVTQLEGLILQVKAVMARCEVCNYER